MKGPFIIFVGTLVAQDGVSENCIIKESHTLKVYMSKLIKNRSISPNVLPYGTHSPIKHEVTSLSFCLKRMMP
jgi:hypothetical protein